MEWVRACNADSLSNGDLISFDYNNNNNNRLLLFLVLKQMSIFIIFCPITLQIYIRI